MLWIALDCAGIPSLDPDGTKTELKFTNNTELCMQLWTLEVQKIQIMVRCTGESDGGCSLHHAQCTPRIGTSDVTCNCSLGSKIPLKLLLR